MKQKLLAWGCWVIAIGAAGHTCSAQAWADSTLTAAPDITVPAAPQPTVTQLPPFVPHSGTIGRYTTSPADSLLRLKRRTWTVAGLHAGLYAGTLILLNEAWYKNYPKGKFRTFNDWPEWKQVDKVGHTWSAYQLSRLSHAGWEWAGLPHRQQIWLAGLSGFTFQTVIEILDGFSAEWGWSWGDFGANAIGSGMFIAQNLAWKEERISFKFSFHRMNYSDPMLNTRSDELYGASLQERMLKDYNGQTYWLSANLKSFFPTSKLPPWLNLAVGYGAEGMFGGTENKWINESTGQAFDRTDIARVRQWYLSPDIDFTRIKTRKAWLKTTFRLLNAFKMPAPAMVLSNGRLRFHALYF
ncbi:MAG: YfiM family protein [Chitinophagaceae bacterium]|nr:YfiM family protein [Chitinophagaceae bacterium]